MYVAFVITYKWTFQVFGVEEVIYKRVIVVKMPQLCDLLRHCLLERFACAGQACISLK